MNASTRIPFEIDGQPVQAHVGETLLEVADRLGLSIPRLCHKPGYRPDGNCRACMVEIEGERVLAASCIRTPAPGMKVRTQTDRAKTARQMVFELLISDQPAWSLDAASSGQFGAYTATLRIVIPPAAKSFGSRRVAREQGCSNRKFFRRGNSLRNPSRDVSCGTNATFAPACSASLRILPLIRYQGLEINESINPECFSCSRDRRLGDEKRMPS